MSLINNLAEYLKTHREMSLNELEVLCKKLGYKLSNGEKRLRDLRAPVLTKNGVKQANPDYIPEIKTRINEHGAIIGYYWQVGLDEIMREIIIPEIQKRIAGATNGCCYWNGASGVHSSNCQTLKVKETNKLF